MGYRDLRLSFTAIATSSVVRDIALNALTNQEY